MRWRIPMDLSPDLVSYRRVLIVGAHILLVPLGYYAAYAIRFDFQIPAAELRVFWATLPYLLAVRLAVFARYGLFRGYWRHVGLRDLVDLGVATTLSTALFVAFLFVFGWPVALPRSVFVLDWLSVVFLSGGLRSARASCRCRACAAAVARCSSAPVRRPRCCCGSCSMTQAAAIRSASMSSV